MVVDVGFMRAHKALCTHRTHFFGAEQSLKPTKAIFGELPTEQESFLALAGK